jgi:hypothetical protein
MLSKTAISATDFSVRHFPDGIISSYAFNEDKSTMKKERQKKENR